MVGPSGSGKSSLVRAGLIPALKCDAVPGSSTWAYDIFCPGDDPLQAFAQPLVARLEPAALSVARLVEARELADRLAAGALPIGDVLRQVLAILPAGTRLFLFADQFEETFTPARDLDEESLRTHREKQRAFLHILLAAADMPRVTVVFALRADFYG